MITVPPLKDCTGSQSDEFTERVWERARGIQLALPLFCLRVIVPSIQGMPATARFKNDWTSGWTTMSKPCVWHLTNCLIKLQPYEFSRPLRSSSLLDRTYYISIDSTLCVFEQLASVRKFSKLQNESAALRPIDLLLFLKLAARFYKAFALRPNISPMPKARPGFISKVLPVCCLLRLP